jgi:signal transduction histidine kinase
MKKLTMLRSLKRKIFVSSAIILSWCGIVSLTIVNYFMTYTLYRTHTIALQCKAVHMQKDVMNLLHEQDKRRLYSFLKEWIKEDFTLDYAFVAQNAELVASTAHFSAEGLATTIYAKVTQPTQQFLVVDHTTFLQLAYPLEQAAVLYLGTSLETFDDSLKTMRWILILLALAFASFGLGMIYSFVVFFTRPVSELVEAVKHVGSGGLHYRLPHDREDEIGMLVQSFNQMMDSLQKNLVQIQQSEKLAVVGELAAGVAHEINNPLDGLQNSIRLIRNDPSNTEQMNLLLPLMAEALDRIEFIVKKLLTFSRKQALQKNVVDVDHLIVESLEFVMHKIKGKAIALRYTPPEPPISLRADERQLSQALINIILNAIDSMDRDGCLTIVVERTTMRGRDMVKVAVEDTGCGMTPEVLAKIFDPFFTTKKDGKGTGLGLTVSLNIVKEHNGEIEVKSVVHQGSTFIIQVPTG